MHVYYRRPNDPHPSPHSPLLDLGLTMTVAAKGASAAWRQAGLSYLQYLSIASKAVRNSLKEPAKSRALGRESLFYNKAVGLGDKVGVTSNLPK